VQSGLARWLITFCGNLTYFTGSFRSSDIPHIGRQYYSSHVFVALSLQAHDAVLQPVAVRAMMCGFLERESLCLQHSFCSLELGTPESSSLLFSWIMILTDHVVVFLDYFETLECDAFKICRPSVLPSDVFQRGFVNVRPDELLIATGSSLAYC